MKMRMICKEDRCDWWDTECPAVETAGYKMIDVLSATHKKSQEAKTTPAKHLGRQILRSGISPALNYGEAQSAESREDFVHKMKICLKELRETLICLKLITKRNWFPTGKLSPILVENNELVSIFVASTKTVIAKSK